MDYLGHRTEDGREQSLKDHLNGVSELAGQFAGSFGESEYGRLAGRYHDIGKYSREFQRYIRKGGGEKVDHSTAGMQVFLGLRNNAVIPIAFSIAGHHAGLPDGGSRKDIASDPTIFGRKRRQVPDYTSYREELPDPGKIVPSPFLIEVWKNRFSQQFYTRMLFSCLVDADYLDTERFMQGDPGRGAFASVAELEKKLTSYVAKNFSHPNSEINKKRTAILQECLTAGREKDAPLQSLTVPTGGGKTIASLAFALCNAVRMGRERIIYVIPYTSIIEQTAAVFREILGEENVVEHHVQAEYDDTDERMNRQRLATENWDAPVIVTTNVQFFESLFANRSSRCRKLHNIANSVVVFDEAQMIPVPFLKPCMEAIRELISGYRCTALLCTATQPSLGKFFSEQHIEEICGDIPGNHEFFRRVKIVYLDQPIGQDELAAKLMAERQVLCIVNTKKTARELFEKLSGEGNWHLSTNLYPKHRERQLAAVRESLKKDETCRVVATSLIEAGVDVDFPFVYRQMAGLDSIVQAAGRCNREGKRDREKSQAFVFRFEQEKTPTSIALNRSIAEEICEDKRYADDLGSPEAIQRYFERLHKIETDSNTDGLDAQKILDCIKEENFPFAEIARRFMLIRENTKPVLIPLEEKAKEIEKALGSGHISRSLLRQAGKYCVSVRCGKEYAPLETMQRNGAIGPLDERGELYVLLDESQYDRNIGLNEKAEEGQAMIY